MAVGKIFKKILPFLGPIGGVASALTQGRGAGRQAEAEQLARQQQVALQAALFNRQAPGARATAGVRGDILANAQPGQFTGTGRDLSFSGGLSPSLLSRGTRDLGRSMSRQALLSQLGRGGVADPYTFNTAPFQPPRAGRLDKLLGGIGLAGGIGSLFAPREDDDEDQPRQPINPRTRFPSLRF